MRGRKQTLHLCKVCGEDNPLEFYNLTKNKCKRCCIESSKGRFTNSSNNKNYHKNIIRLRFLMAKRRAKIKNLDFDITIDFLHDLLKSQNNRCFYSGRLFDNKFNINR